MMHRILKTLTSKHTNFSLRKEQALPHPSFLLVRPVCMHEMNWAKTSPFHPHGTPMSVITTGPRSSRIIIFGTKTSWTYVLICSHEGTLIQCDHLPTNWFSFIPYTIFLNVCCKGATAWYPECRVKTCSFKVSVHFFYAESLPTLYVPLVHS